MFGEDSVLHLPFQAAAKTGTSNDFRDNWTLGYTPDIAVGVWVGNADYTPMQDITGMTGAAPIWSEFMKFAIQKLNGGNPTPFVKPSGVVDRVICTVSGTEPSQWCPNQRSEYFVSDQLPLPSSMDLWSKVVFDTWTGLRASSACSDYTKEEFAINVTDPWAIGWIQNDPDGKAWEEEMGFTDSIRTYARLSNR
jgi:membrane carboxypeptidase/penicillin-binding protein PbpC